VRARVGFTKHGYWPIIPLLLSLAVSLSTITQKREAIHFLLSLFGVAGVVYMMGLTREVWNALHSLKSMYWILPRHNDRLGLQFAVGDDLRSLLLGWIPVETGFSNAVRAIGFRFFASAVVLLVIVYALHQVAYGAILERGLTSSLAAYLIISFLAAVDLIILLLPLALVMQVDFNRRVLLVVDDLDRCHPDQLLEIVECLQLFLDDVEVKKRLKVVMLIEEDVLRHALQSKYAKMFSPQADSDDQSRLVDHIVTENLEKLFLLWLRLEKLDSAEINEVFCSVCDSLVTSGEAIKTPNPVASSYRDSGTAERSGLVFPETSNRKKEPSSATATSPGTDAEVQGSPALIDCVLTEGEANAIKDTVSDIIIHSGRTRWSPRAINSFLFRYQLARMLLEKHGRTFPVRDIAIAIAAASDRDASGSPQDVDPTLLQIARQVA
jgi:hypothetical protein